VAERMQARMGRPVTVENRTGAGGNIGLLAAARAAPDGYTLGVTHPGVAAGPILSKSFDADPLRDYTHIIALVNAPSVLITNGVTPFKNMAELITMRRPTRAS